MEPTHHGDVERALRVVVGVGQLRGEGGQHHGPQVRYLYLARGLVHLHHRRVRSLQWHTLSCLTIASDTRHSASAPSLGKYLCTLFGDLFLTQTAPSLKILLMILLD